MLFIVVFFDHVFLYCISTKLMLVSRCLNI